VVPPEFGKILSALSPITVETGIAYQRSLRQYSSKAPSFSDQRGLTATALSLKRNRKNTVPSHRLSRFHVTLSFFKPNVKKIPSSEENLIAYPGRKPQ
jgi:hypothetical protein